MINRLVYEVRLRRSEHHRPWRWDVSYLKTTDPEFSGVETGRKELGHDWGYERFKWVAIRKIVKRMNKNNFKGTYVER